MDDTTGKSADHRDDRIVDELDRLSRRGSPADAEGAVAKAFDAAASSEMAAPSRPGRTLVSVAAASLVVIALGASAYVVANRQPDDTEPLPAATVPDTADSAVPSTTVASTPDSTTSTAIATTTIPIPTSFPAPALGDLGLLDSTHLVVPSVVPDGWTITPSLIGDGSQRWTFENPARKASGSVRAYSAPDVVADAADRPSGEPVRWSVEMSQEMFRVYTARADTNDQVAVTVIGSDPALFDDFLLDFDEFLLGLTVGDRAQHPAGAFDAQVDGTVAAAGDSDDVSLRAAAVGDHLCWSMSPTVFSTRGCARDPFDDVSADGPELDTGIAVLSQGGLGIPQNSTDPDAAIVTTIVRLAGVTLPSIDNVAITLATGETVTVPTGEVNDELGLRFFVYVTVVDGSADVVEHITSITAAEST
ncbi:hypothetical protein [Ilumatobacter coccineus]|uniref:Uncharacterized protein n=1 Tax=Ilumatobacter coccineus (strain NBRC 103263 / KCTC 29153 / YM16-304) TaxID=1313172 RepID=A0A6C7EA82_ILUCY|nr:hypothetical protein [Ilumatobacter coccineus]BAN03243.1 hypothetical protein YM304_29290 [Ilumatobacter coccineus YM16-304]